MKIRIQKFLAERGIGSRRQIENMIKNKRIKANDKLAKLGMKVDENDRIEIDNRLIEMNSEKKIYIMFNKPMGVLSTCRKSREKGKTVLDYIKIDKRIYPIGRLDRDSEGLLLLTNDGDLALKLTHPRYEHEKEYMVKIREKRLSSGLSSVENREIKAISVNKVNRVNTIVNNYNNILKQLENGVDIGGYITKKSTVRCLTKNLFLITLKEGKNRQIRRMCEKVGLEVVKLKRVRIGKLRLGDLKVGEWEYIRNKKLRNKKLRDDYEIDGINDDE